MSRTLKKFKGKIYQDRASRNRKATRSCLNNGGCPYCLSNRMHKHKRKMTDYKKEIE